jgi:aspartyl-tRNA(Asn)/glutamyl-tRNA(Gln) amidotransferase subunit A
MIGTYVLSSGYYDAYYRKAAKVRTKLIQEFATAFSQCDVLVGPTAPEVAPQIGENASDPLTMYLLDIMTVSVNLIGTPGLSIPVKAPGMPVGLQIIAPMKKDKELLMFAQSIEKVVS